jgi:cephalosporin hydroxylase
MTSIPEHQTQIPNADAFAQDRERWRTELSSDETLRKSAIDFQVACSRYMYTYQFDWLGVPIIRLPDDIIVLQEIIFQLRPRAVIETGIARGGSLVLSASLMAIVGLEARVLGLDIQILEHTRKSIETSIFSRAIEMWVGDSASEDAEVAVSDFLKDIEEPCLLILDSDHTHDHVLRELQRLAPVMPKGSIIAVADTLIEEMPEDFYSDREWGKGNNPLSALKQFISENPHDYKEENLWSRRAIQSEFRDGIISKL